MKIVLKVVVLTTVLLFASLSTAQNAQQANDVGIAQNECAPKIGWIPLPYKKSDANLVPQNIKTGVTIFGVKGTFPSPETVESAKDECLSLCSITGYDGIGVDIKCFQKCEQGVDILYGKLQQ